MQPKEIPDAEIRNHIDKSFMSGILKLMILRKIKHGNDYPYSIMKEFECNPHAPMKNITKNDVYNTLNALEKGGYVKSSSRKMGNKIQKRYVLTASGRKMVIKSRKAIIKHIKEAKKLVAEFNE